MCFEPLELDCVLNKLKGGSSVKQKLVQETTDTSGEDTDADQPQRRVGSRRTFKIKKSYAVAELARFFVTGLTNVAIKRSMQNMENRYVATYTRQI